MTTAVTLDVRPVSGALGAEVRGVRLGHLDDQELAAVRAVLLEHLVLFFPDQHLEPDEHIAFASWWGELEVHPFIPKLDPEHQQIVVLDGDKGGRADVWHTDVTFRADPPICSILQMNVCPSAGGDTMFTNQYRVYESLSEPIQELCRGLTAIHSARPFGHPEMQAEHPVVRVHPETGRRSLYVNRTFTERIVQLDRAASAALLDYLYTFSEQPQFTCRYRWAEGTVGMWDNRVTQHYAVNDYSEPRQIQRITVIGDHPEGEPPRWPAAESDRSPYSIEANGA
jgi:taurine dioxygenase